MMPGYDEMANPLEAKGIPGIHKLEEKKVDPKKAEPTIKVNTHRFTVQFVWRPKNVSERLEQRRLEQRDAARQLDSQVAGGGS
jgi:hypothetical protein